MEKIAFRSFAGKVRHVGRKAKVLVHKNPTAVGASLGAAGGGALGRVEGAYNEKHHKRDVKIGIRAGKTMGTIGGAIAGGVTGGGIGRTASLNREYKKWSRRFVRGFGNSGRSAPRPQNVKPPDWAKGAKTKAEVKTRYRAQAMKHHPDRGGNAETMKKVNTEWEAFEKSPNFKKLGHVLSSFLDELELIRAASC